jgi:hypothetical protein
MTAPTNPSEPKRCAYCGHVLNPDEIVRYVGWQRYCEICSDKIIQLSPDPDYGGTQNEIDP